MAKFLITAHAEFYCYVEAGSQEEALDKSKKNNEFHRTMNKPFHDYNATEVEDKKD